MGNPENLNMKSSVVNRTEIFNSSRSGMMRNIVKVLAQTLIMNVILRDTEGAKLNAVKVVDGFHDPRITTGSPPVSGGNNVTHAFGYFGSVMSWEKLTF